MNDELLKMVTYKARKENLTLGALPLSKNQDIVKNCPHYIFSDVVVFPMALWVGDGLSAIMKITHAIAKSWGVSEDIIFQDATRNLENSVAVEKLDQILQDNGVNLGDDECIEMYVMTNDQMYYGAATMMCRDALATFANDLDALELIIIPSSIHEVLLIPVREGDDKDALLNHIGNIIPEINETILDEDERLSDHPFMLVRNEFGIWRLAAFWV